MGTAISLDYEYTLNRCYKLFYFSLTTSFYCKLAVIYLKIASFKVQCFILIVQKYHLEAELCFCGKFPDVSVVSQEDMPPLKSGFKHSTYSVVMHSSYTQDTKSPRFSVISLSLMVQTPLNLKIKPQPTKQQPQNPEALQEYFLSHKISQSLL